MNWLISDALAQQAPAAGSQGSPLISIAMFAGIFVLFYFLFIRPQSKRAKEHRQMVSALGKGDDIITSGGLVGRIRDLDDNFVTVEIADKVQVRVQRQAVQTVLPKGTVDKEKK